MGDGNVLGVTGSAVGNLTFTTPRTTGVPDGGSSAVLLGLALVGTSLAFRRK